MKKSVFKKARFPEIIQFFIAMAIIMEIPFLGRFPIVASTQSALQVLLAILILIQLIRKSKISRYNILLIICLALYIFSTYLNNGNIKGVLSESLGVLSLSLLIEYGLKEKRVGLMKGAYYFFLCCVVINLVTLFASPTGLYVTENLQYATKLNWFLGYKNLHILFLFQLILWGVIYDIYNKKKVSKKTIIATALSFITAMAAKSTTTLVGLIIIAILLLLNELRKDVKILRIYNFLILYIATFISIVFLRLQEKYDDFIFDLTQKHSDFVGRTNIWDSVLGFIKERPLIGYGKEESIIRQTKTIRWQAAHAHNGILEVFYRIGVVGAALVAALIGMSFRELNKHKNEKITKALIAMIASMFVMLLTEYYAPQFIIPLLTIAYNIRYLLNGKEKITG